MTCRRVFSRVLKVSCIMFYGISSLRGELGCFPESPKCFSYLGCDFFHYVVDKLSILIGRVSYVLVVLFLSPQTMNKFMYIVLMAMATK